MIRFIKNLAIFTPITTLLLVGCGGGDDGTGSAFQAPSISTTPVSITTSNDDAVANTSFIALETSSSLSDTGDIVGFKSGSNGQSTLLSFLMQQILGSIEEVSGDGVESPRILPVGVVASEVEQCPVSGTTTITTNTVNIVQSSADVSAGDSFTISSAACDDGSDLVSGSMTFTFNNGNQLSDIGVVFNNLSINNGVETLIVHGDFRLQLSASLEVLDSSNATITISGSSLFFIESGGDAIHITDFSVTLVTSGSNFTIDSTMTVDSTIVDGRLTITANAVSGSAGQSNPSSGNVVVVGNSSKLTVSIISDTNVDLELDSDNDGNVDVTTNVTWTNLGN